MAVNRSAQVAFANIAASTTDGALIAAPTAPNRIRVLGVLVVGGTSVGAVTFNSKGGGAGTAISANFSPAASGGFAWGASDLPLFMCNRGEALTVTTGATTTPVAVQVVYDITPM